ncbi:MAG: hypothetical protein QXS93_01935 [Candidatus Micrarchaeia archaeon]
MPDVLHPFGDLDVVGYYSTISSKLKNFLAGKELAGKVLFPGARRPLLTRGTKLPPLFVKQLAENVDDKFLEIRKGHHLEDVKDKLTPTQQIIWRYFPPRKLADLFYATNGEKGTYIDRIFFDIDRGEGISTATAQKVAYSLVVAIQEDSDFQSLTKSKIYVQYTGSSFHVYILLKKPQPKSFYDKYFAFGKSQSSSFATKWAKKICAEIGINVLAGHEKVANAIILDPSQTPPGKLARAPFSLHMSDAKTVDGVAIPIYPDMLEEPGLIKSLSAYTPDMVVDELSILSKRIIC